MVAGLTEAVVGALMRRQPQGGTFHIEDIQDQVELALMRSGEHDVARAYVLYREERAKARAQEKARAQRPKRGLHVVEHGQRKPLDRERAARAWSSRGLRRPGRRRARRRSSRPRCATCTTACRWTRCASRAILAARALIEKDPAYSYVTARLLLHTIRLEVLGEEVSQAEMETRYAELLPAVHRARHRRRAARPGARRAST